ncbi:hypothetical protein GV828_02175 [Flavobacterium sp. NST-5]|uniref:DUF4468 domain-containing protein n=1 Tax=Flavobacterium ichthyis TaxID=2698827 RepID=A0ABW9Z9I2_9FLAO|nr:hypothetical protein [Flavobacterium ichthyis]NBL64002.1 hypothetical protein [Flavobacterium ichthyis]
MKNYITLFLFINCFTVWAQVAKYHSTGYHFQKFDTFLEDFEPFNKECVKQETFLMMIKGPKIRMEAKEYSYQNHNIVFNDVYKREIKIVDTLVANNNAKFHFQIEGIEYRYTYKKPTPKDSTNFKETILPFTGTVYGFTFNIDELLKDQIESGDLYFKLVYKNGDKLNFYNHLSQKPISQIEKEKEERKIQEAKDLAEAEHLKIQKAENDRKRAQEQAESIKVLGNTLNALISTYK